MRERRGACKVLVGKYERKRSLEKPKNKREDNIKTDLQEIGWETWTGLIWLRIGTGLLTVMNLRIRPLNTGKFSTK